jgi:hypothetical protein
MRYHKAIALSKPEADFLIETGTSSESGVVVISRGDKYFDVRAMTHAEVDAFVADLARSEHAEEAARLALRC